MKQLYKQVRKIERPEKIDLSEVKTEGTKDDISRLKYKQP